MSEFIETKLYKGKVIVKFFPDSHQYWVDGKRKSGVTTILGIKDKSTALMSWQGEETAKALFKITEKGLTITNEDIVNAIFAHKKSVDASAELGHQIHKWVENYINHKLKKKGFESVPEMPEDKNVITGVTSFLEWESEHKVKYLWSEKILYSKKYDYIGCGDFGAIVDGKMCLCDIKTGNGMYNSVLAQTSAYAHADTEESGMKYDGRWAIRIAKETEKEYHARMELKNKIKSLLGKKETEVETYKVFDALFLDDEKGAMKYDFEEGFLSHQNLLRWDRKTDFYTNKK